MSEVKKVSETPIIYVIDYSNLKVAQMIALQSELKSHINSEKSNVKVISIFNDKSYATPEFMRATEKITSEVINRIDDQAIVGLNATKRIILKGYNLLFDRNFKSFESLEEAIEHLKRQVI